MKIVIGQVKEVDGKYSMARCVELPEFGELPSKVIKGILFKAYKQLLDVERSAEIAELEKLAQT